MTYKRLYHMYCKAIYRVHEQDEDFFMVFHDDLTGDAGTIIFGRMFTYSNETNLLYRINNT